LWKEHPKDADFVKREMPTSPSAVDAPHSAVVQACLALSVLAVTKPAKSAMPPKAEANSEH
jgi:hypothetical protein